VFGVAMTGLRNTLDNMCASAVPRFGNGGKPAVVGIAPAKSSFMSHFYNHYHYFYKFDRL
jgi:hypothetical protein